MNKKSTFQERMNDWFFIVESPDGTREILCPDEDEDQESETED